MESLLGEKPFMNPIALASSSRAGTESDSSDISSFDYDAITDPAGSSSSCKRKKNHLANAILESRKIAEENKLKCHQQTMDQRSKLLNALDKLVDKLQVIIFFIELLTFNSYFLRLILLKLDFV